MTTAYTETCIVQSWKWRNSDEDFFVSINFHFALLQRICMLIDLETMLVIELVLSIILVLFFGHESNIFIFSATIIEAKAEELLNFHF